MKEDIYPIYNNSFGISFQWKNGTAKTKDKIQIVFRDTGLLLSHEELELFSRNVQCTKKGKGLCNTCKNEIDCRSLLLDTPVPQVSLAVSHRELGAIEDLVQGTLFQLDLNQYINTLCKD